MKKLFVSLVVVLLNLTFNHLIVSSESTLDLSLGTIDKIIEENNNGLHYQYIELTDTNNNLQKIFYTSFKPSESSPFQMVLHHLEDEKGNFVNATVEEIAKDYEAKTGQKVTVAVNGDFFIGPTPVDYYVKDGEILHVGPYDWKNSFGFNDDGTSTIGRVKEIGLKLKLEVNGEIKEFVVDKVNGEPLEGEIAIITPDRYRTISFKDTAKYLVSLDRDRMADYSFPIGGTAYRLAKGEVTTDNLVSLASDKVMIAIKGDNELSQYFYEHFNYGARIDVVQIPEGQFTGLNWVIGGYSVLVSDGVVLPKGAHTDNGGDSLAPRTTIGVTQTGEFFLSVIDGRNSTYSKGVTVSEQAQLAFDFNAKHALELDGGGSSTFLYRINDELQVVNQPSDGYLRKVSNAVLITYTPPVNEEPIEEPNIPEEPVEQPPITDEPIETPIAQNDKPDNELFFVIGISILVGIGITGYIIYSKRQ